MKKFFTVCFFVAIFILSHPHMVFCGELDGWIKSDMCWVAKTPDIKAPIVGIISKKAAVTVKEINGNWLRIVFAPIRDPKTGKWIECSGCYIKKDNFTTTIPSKW